MNGVTYADAATFHGWLQRGRGVAALRARAEPEAADSVYECVVTDSRWDRQTEQRDSYLARLMYRPELPVAPVARYLFGYGGDDREQIGLAVGVLALLVFVGRVDAAVVLRRYSVEGRHWSCAVEALGDIGAWKVRDAWDGLAEDIIAAHDDTELAAHIFGGWEPRASFARTQPRIRRILDEHAARRSAGPARPAMADEGVQVSIGDLVGRVAGTSGRDRMSALRELGGRGDLSVLDLAEAASLRNGAGWTPGIVEALRALGAAAVTRARRWVDTGDSTLRTLAVGVLSDFGGRVDGPSCSTRSSPPLTRTRGARPRHRREASAGCG